MPLWTQAVPVRNPSPKGLHHSWAPGKQTRFPRLSDPISFFIFQLRIPSKTVRVDVDSKGRTSLWIEKTQVLLGVEGHFCVHSLYHSIPFSCLRGKESLVTATASSKTKSPAKESRACLRTCSCLNRSSKAELLAGTWSVASQNRLRNRWPNRLRSVFGPRFIESGHRPAGYASLRLGIFENKPFGSCHC